MRFMVIVKASKESETGALPDREMLTEMGRYNEELERAGMLIAAEGLQPSSKGVRVKFSGAKRTVSEGPFSGTKDLIAGFWLLEAKSMDEVIDWVKRSPMDDTELEIRQVHELSDFGSAITPELREQEERLRLRVHTAGRR